MKSISAERCSECGSSLLLHDSDNAEVVCGKCGFVLTSIVTDRGPEWRAFTHEEREKKVRVGAPQTLMLHDKGLATKIDWRDISGFDPERKAQFNRIRHWQQRSRVSSCKERNLAIALSEINRVSEALGLPKNIAETSAILYRKAINEGVTRGRSIRGIANACTYLACRQNKLIRTITEVSKASNISRKVIASNYRFLIKKLKIFVPPMRSNQHINKLSNQIGFTGMTEGVAHKILMGAKKEKLTSGRGPKSIGAAACYIASILTGERKTQREIAEAADLTEVTIRNRYKEMIKRLEIIISL
jgi:transcription initiation factor TFIIB